MRWMVLDGIDATGKSTLCKRIRELYFERDLNCKIKTEFSSTFLGKGIEEIIKRHRFFRLDQERTTWTADLMVILADVFCKYEIDVESEIDVAVMERGVISALGYQLIRLYNHAPEARESGLEEALLDYIGAVEKFSRWPDCHFTLKISQAEMERRVVARGESPLSGEQSAILMAIQRKMLSFGSLFRTIDIAVDARSVDAVALEIIEAFDRRTLSRR